MAFITKEQVMSLVEDTIQAMWKTIHSTNVTFNHMTFAQALGQVSH